MNNILHAIIPNQECVTSRHLLERIVADCFDALKARDILPAGQLPLSKTENVNSLVANLQWLLLDKGKFVIVFDGIERQVEAVPTLLAALARLPEYVSFR